jgi:formate dehydrogenase subunit beta
MIEILRKKVADMLETGEVSGFLGLRNLGAEPFPFLFTKGTLQELDQLTIGAVRYPLSKIIIKISAKYPENKFGIMCRACDERALIELCKNAKISVEKVITIGIPCTDELVKACICNNPHPSNVIADTVEASSFNRSDVEKIISMPLNQRFDYWTAQLGKCIKCYGCRNICPVCFCDVCTLEDQPLVKRGEIPPEVPSFHLTRAYHMVGRCIDCGLCEEGCPMDIPLRTLYRRVREIVKDLFDYLPGEERDTVPPIQVLGDGTFEIRD